jgi:transposase-like protein
MNLTDTRFQDPDKAREYLETQRWPNGPACPHCGNCDQDKITGLKGKAHRPGVYQCNECREQFTVTVGSVMERSKIPLNKWLMAMHLMGASKKSMSAHQIHRMLGITYQSAWFLCHRIREAMADDSHTATGGLGGANKVVEVDETYVGGKAKNRAFKEAAPKKAILSLIERDGRVASFHIANVTAKTVRPIIVANVNRTSALMTDESMIYPNVGKEFANHHAVNHSANEYARMCGYVHTNTAENFYSILKRGLIGTYHHVSEAHLHRYLAEFDFRYNTRSGLGVEDTERVSKIAAAVGGKRLMYRAADRTANV